MKVLLIYPYFLSPRVNVREIAAVPMGVYYIGAFLKSQNYDVEIINWHDAGDALDMIKDTLISKKPDVIGFSIMHSNRWGGIDIARVAKQLLPGVPVVFGGVGATFLWRHLLTNFLQIDYIVLGEGELPFSNLLAAIEKGASPEEIAGIAGLAFRTPRGITRTAQAPLIENLDELPQPAQCYDFENLSLARGCPGRCTFCGSPEFWKRRERTHSTDYLVDQLVMLSKRGITHFCLSDDTFTLNSKKVIRFCRKIIDKGLDITWQAISKVSSVNDEMLYWMRKAGCLLISYGVESGSPQIRKRLCKDIQTDQIKMAFERTVAHGIMARAYIIIGSPGETQQTIDQTLDLIRQIKPLMIVYYILDIFPGTALYESYKERANVNDDIWLQRIEDIMYFQTDDALDQETVLDWANQLKEAYNQWLPEFALDINFKDDASLVKEQADLLSQLAVTFSHGDYSKVVSTADSIEVTCRLYERALSMCPDDRAFWGLSLVHQLQGECDASVELLQRGLRHFPDSPELNILIGRGYLNKAEYRKAIEHLRPYKERADAAPHYEQCRQALKD